jgi:hypothetical protein
MGDESPMINAGGAEGGGIGNSESVEIDTALECLEWLSRLISKVGEYRFRAWDISASISSASPRSSVKLGRR